MGASLTMFRNNLERDETAALLNIAVDTAGLLDGSAVSFRDHVQGVLQSGSNPPNNNSTRKNTSKKKNKIFLFGSSLWRKIRLKICGFAYGWRASNRRIFKLFSFENKALNEKILFFLFDPFLRVESLPCLLHRDF